MTRAHEHCAGTAKRRQCRALVTAAMAQEDKPARAGGSGLWGQQRLRETGGWGGE